jgi:uncharacterized protein (DUF302 family)
VATKTSPVPVEDTVARLTAEVVAKGMKVFIIVDHSDEAAAYGLELRDTKVVVFGSPDPGTPVMEAAPLAALELPLEVLIWADDSATRVGYIRPDVLGAPYGLADDLVARLTGIEALTDALVDD